jgi:hypothetical protein
MTTKKNQTGLTGLLLLKMEKQPDLHWYDTDVRSVEDVVIPLADAGLIEIGESYHGVVSVELSAAGKLLAHAARTESLTTSTSSEDRAAAALWRWLLVNGVEGGSYGSEYPWGRSGEVTHILTCGLDLKRSSPVKDDVWTEWDGTFGSGDDRRTGVSGKAVCLCSKRVEVNLHTEVESLTAFLTDVLAFQEA